LVPGIARPVHDVGVFNEDIEGAEFEESLVLQMQAILHQDI